MRISDWSSDVCSSDLAITELESIRVTPEHNINHSCETIPTVDGRRSGRKHLNSLHQCERNCAQIELARIRVRSRIPRSSSIYQNQGCAFWKATKLDCRGVCISSIHDSIAYSDIPVAHIVNRHFR